MVRKDKFRFDKLWSEAIKREANFRCEMCGSDRSLNSHHIFSRRYLSVRWAMRNGICLCAKHHFFAHQNSIEFAKWILNKRGEEWYNLLLLKIRQVKNYQGDLLILMSIERELECKYR
jgi:hypothetical protein